MLQSQFHDRASASPSTDLLQHLSLVDHGAQLKTFRRGQTIPLNPDRIWIVRQGMVHLDTLYPSGDEALIGFAFEGMPFGASMTKVDPYTAVALTDVLLLGLTIEQIQRHPALSEMMCQQSQHRLRQTEALLSMLGYRRIEDRLRQFLILLAGEIGETTGVGIKIGVRLTHQLIANATGTTRVTITRILGELQREGWLVFDKQHHIILSRFSNVQ
jgi:CRP-like cAMP-binding protein